MLKRFNDGDVIHYQVTFPEGITLAKALDILSQQAATGNDSSGAVGPATDGVNQAILTLGGTLFP